MRTSRAAAILLSVGSLLRIRDVPDDVRRALKARAAARGQSLNSYLLRLLARDAGRPTAREVLERAARRVSSDTSVVGLLRAARNERESEVSRRGHGDGGGAPIRQ
jgi:plasmid stability protein